MPYWIRYSEYHSGAWLDDRLVPFDPPILNSASKLVAVAKDRLRSQWDFFLASMWSILSNAMLQFSCSTCVVDTGVAPERMMRAQDYRLLASAYNKRGCRERGVSRRNHAFRRDTRVKDTSWTRKLQHCITQNQSLWLRSFSLANTAPTGFKAELKMNGSNGTYRSM